MEPSRLSGAHQTILVVSVTAAAIIGSVAGAVGAVIMTGAINASDLFGRLSSGDDFSGVDRHIVELIEEESATISVVNDVAPSVVSVVIKRPRGAFYADEFDSYFFDSYSAPPTLTDREASELVEVGGGTGFFMSQDGYVVTNRHVVSDLDATFVVVTNDGVELPATVVARDAFLDIAVLDVAGDGYPVAALGDSDGIRIGQTVIAIGNTLSEYRNTVTKGVVSGINRRVVAGDYGDDEVIERAIQTDAAINPGNSGGPLINLLGEIIGVNTAVSYEGQSIGFAIPIDDVKKVVEDIERYGRIVRPWLGVRYLPVDADVADEFELAYDTGALLVSGSDSETEPAVSAGSPADQAGLLEWDIILSIDGIAIDEDRSLGSLVSELEPEQTVELQIARGDELLTLAATLKELEIE
ncbi:hypothetical protein A2348_00890 [Candidatus Uhrbacteria bacterium RIFOXYB12_FULL_58_10]|uniref:PDZ domain-containing protein n=1 Tax=Candidatus Uhrbacteria bacterium RIFOXYB2_FULL_57_15 TaxID=1802422 RepID=A0A1F7W6D7_9BACT|nr:MAG: hypothetical protein A2348_00890 [Candidatus Uhrbacteria bacterium RIFOXYB12_FULL_58_10]OGL98339.1 MAG: hypothetical protein A2304_01420 [Candidatus Uhrbacteria bacterium RIFOXYB2_FULL_57_15]OGM00204.1 MAG: hypothetical protein A2501_01535 [Candidatus Uhrbacteria bacterium RIFOXYC12_FULL_57_11]